MQSNGSLIPVGIVLLTLVLPGRTPVRGEEAAAPAERVFAEQVLPLFQSRCFPCHGDEPQSPKGDFVMLDRQGLLAGGESGEPAVIPGEPEASPLFQAIRWEGLEMPPKENDRLNEKEVDYVRQWIVAGAPWPDAERVRMILRQTDEAGNEESGVLVPTSGGLTLGWTNRRYSPEDLWAYQPIRRLPTDSFSAVSSEDTSENSSEANAPDTSGNQTNPVDWLLEKQFRERGIEPAPPASRQAWIRRATFDLTGLPPTPEEVRDFLQDPASDAEACARVVERLLASPHYGEKWGRHWLDVVRYADSSGFANDYERGNAWRYRDYVIRAFNDDKPYDQFVREQLAGDEINSDDPEMLVAVGFLRMGPWELTGMEVPKVARQRFLDDVTDAVGQVFLGHMLQCARCHDHKFDPVPTRDYYAMQAIFSTTQLAEREAAFLAEENTTGFEERDDLLRRREFYQRTLRELEQKQTLEAARKWYADQGRDATEFERTVAELEANPQAENSSETNLLTVGKVRQALQRKGVDPDLIFPRHVGFEPIDYGMERIARKGLERLRWRLERYEPFALSVYSGRTPSWSSVHAPLRIPTNPLQDGELEQTAILTGGDPFSPAEEVQPGVLSAVRFAGREGEETSTGTIPHEIAGRRLALADWMVAPENPLTARVMVNRMWLWHFGRPLAGNPNNFGATGQRPTHPELLDELAGRFIDSGWSIKSMHRLLMNSEAYRRSARHPDPEQLAHLDPEGTSYAVFRARRLTAEELRDAMLAISGELNTMIGGIPARPEMNPEVALQPRQVMGTFAEAWQPANFPSSGIGGPFTRCEFAASRIHFWMSLMPLLLSFPANGENPRQSLPRSSRCSIARRHTTEPLPWRIVYGRSNVPGGRRHGICFSLC
jgi:mono/diheme cytochrome c family protein